MKHLYLNIADIIFEIQTNEGGGDCLFYSLKEVVGNSIKELRKIVANTIDNNNYPEVMSRMDYKNMTLKELKRFIMTSKHWATDYDIEVLAANFNLNIVVLDSSKFILQCFMYGEPEKNLVMLYNITKLHFELISKESRSTFDFNELPVDIQETVIQKCGTLKRFTGHNFALRELFF